MSKGSAPRPFSVDRKQFEDNWDKIFGDKCPTVAKIRDRYQKKLEEKAAADEANQK